MLSLAIVVNPPSNETFFPFILAAIGLYLLYLGIKGLFEKDGE